jgi:hypothetical protein
VKELPAATLRLFDGYAPDDLLRPEHRGFLIERLLEEGDRKDLRWLAAQVGEAELRDFFQRAGGRRLSARSRAFWSLVLGDAAPAAAASSEGSEIWPLA